MTLFEFLKSRTELDKKGIGFYEITWSKEYSEYLELYVPYSDKKLDLMLGDSPIEVTISKMLKDNDSITIKASTFGAFSNIIVRVYDENSDLAFSAGIRR